MSTIIELNQKELANVSGGGLFYTKTYTGAEHYERSGTHFINEHYRTEIHTLGYIAMMSPVIIAVASASWYYLDLPTTFARSMEKIRDLF